MTNQELRGVLASIVNECQDIVNQKFFVNAKVNDQRLARCVMDLCKCLDRLTDQVEKQEVTT